MENQKKMLGLERDELNKLIGKGVTFEVQDYNIVYKRYLFGLIRKKSLKPIKRKYKIEEPTLGTLDRLSREWVDMAIDHEALKGEDAMRQARILASQHAQRCAKVIAIAVIGSDYLIPKVSRGGSIRYDENDKRLNELTHLFLEAIKPSDLFQIYALLAAMCNLGDFMNSIRLMSADRTTQPIRIEHNNEG